MTTWRVVRILLRTVQQLLDAATTHMNDPNILREQKFEKIRRELVRRYYGVGEQRSWTRRELAGTYRLPVGRVERCSPRRFARYSGLRQCR